MRAYLIAHTPEPEKVVAAAAKLCYSNSTVESLMEGLDEEKTARFIQKLADLGHESPMEHASFTFAVEGVSRALLAQLTRHRLASYSVQSQRYVKLDDFSFVLPPAIEADEEAKALYLETMQRDAEAYTKLTETLQKKYYEEYLAAGLSEKAAAGKAEKQSIEDARFVFPNACETKLVVTMNARSLMNFFRHRCCMRAQWEIRALADEMLRLVYDKAPNLFKKAGAPCVDGPCPEGAMCCGKTAAVRAYYEELKGTMER